jgi:bacteriocin-like protein
MITHLHRSRQELRAPGIEAIWKRDQAPVKRGHPPWLYDPEALSRQSKHTAQPVPGEIMNEKKKLTLSKETLRTLDEKELSQIVGGAASGSHEPPRGGPNSCPNTKAPGCS